MIILSSLYLSTNRCYDRRSGSCPKFWDNMAYLLEQGEKIGIYVPEDYSENPVDYCGMEINSTPYKSLIKYNLLKIKMNLIIYGKCFL